MQHGVSISAFASEFRGCALVWPATALSLRALTRSNTARATLSFAFVALGSMICFVYLPWKTTLCSNFAAFNDGLMVPGATID